jgi:hypothetical protein
MVDSEINDVRLDKDFKGSTFSKFKKTDVKKELLNSLIKTKIEPACYWSAELICAGHYVDLWDIIIFFYTKFIHLGNPKIAIYLELRLNQFKNIVRNGFLGNELRLRNNDKIRRMFCEIMCILCDAKRKHSFDNIKILKEDFDMTLMTDRFKAPSIKYAEEIFMKDDPKELFVAMNEFAYNISEDYKNIVSACYWMEWIIEFDTVCKIKKEKCKCERRSNIPVDSKFQMEIIWMIWDIFLLESQTKPKIFQKIINALLTLFTLKYTIGCHKKRKYILYFIVSMFCENIDVSDDIIRESQKEVIVVVIDKIDIIYKQIKKNEESPETDYLFKDVKQSNLEKTIQKLETMNTFGETFMPRI